MGSTADVVHLDLLSAAQAQRAARLAVSIGTLQPGAANQLRKFLIVGAIAHGCPQIQPSSGEQAGVEPAFRGEARAAAGAAEGLRHRGDEPNLAAAVIEAPALRDLALVVLRYGMDRPALVDSSRQFA